MNSIGNILQERLKKYQDNPEAFLKRKSKDYNKEWNEAVNYFVIRINRDRKREGGELVSFISVRMKLVALKEIDGLRWLYLVCEKYSKTKDKEGRDNTFSKCFYGSLKIR